jgi:uncharacterized protein (DUF305 family)
MNFAKKISFAILAAGLGVLPGLALAQTNEPSAHLHAMPPVGSSTALAPDLMAAMHTMHAKMEAMKLSGAVDNDFAMMMRMHHQGAIDMAKIEIARGKDPAMKKMAEKMVAAQTKEIAELDKWIARHPAEK